MKMIHRIKSWRLTEKQRTFILLVLLAFAVGFIIWSRQQYSANFIDSF